MDSILGRISQFERPRPTDTGGCERYSGLNLVRSQRSLRALFLFLAGYLPLMSGCDESPGSGLAPDATAQRGELSATVSPAAGMTNVNLKDPIVVTFSEPVLPSQIDATVRVLANGRELSYETEYSGEGRIFQLQITEPPALPAEIRIEIDAAELGKTGAYFEGLNSFFLAPLFLPLASQPNGTPAAVVVDASGALRTASVHSDGVVFYSLGANGWEELASLDLEIGSPIGTPELLQGSSWFLVFLERDSDTLVVIEQTDEGLKRVEQTVNATDFAHTHSDALGTVFAVSDGASVSFLDETLSPHEQLPPSIERMHRALHVTADEDGLISVLIDDEGRLHTYRSSASGHEELGAVGFGAEVGGVALSDARSANVLLSWSEGPYAYVAELNDNVWVTLDQTLRAHQFGEEDALPIAVRSHSETVRHLLLRQGTFLFAVDLNTNRFLGAALSSDEATGGTLEYLPDGSLVLSLDNSSNPLQLNFAQPSYGLAPLPEKTPCALPADTDPAFPQTLAMTGCYASTDTQTPTEGALYYEIASPLWSDGTLKRRFLILPSNTSITVQDNGDWDFPVGTVILKEFWLEGQAGPFPIETRVMIHRCSLGSCIDPWQGYSYIWNEESTDAALLSLVDGVQPVLWEVDGSSFQHDYPGRNTCNQCHNPSMGSVLGLETRQMNLNTNYGGIADNQLRAFAAAGAFGPEPPDFGSVPGYPDPTDGRSGLYERVRSYMHTNCAHCHNPNSFQGLASQSDFRFDASLPESSLCSYVDPGNVLASQIYAKVSVRAPAQPVGGGNPMPPVATQLVDAQWLNLLGGWVSGLTACP
ncbi:MAG: Ig-like domain-containing protein [Myxococcota bacterium]